MTKTSKIKNNLSPICVQQLTLNPSSKIKDEIKEIGIKYEFKDEALWLGLVNLINWFQLEKDLERQKLRPADEKKILAKLKDKTDELLILIGNSGIQVRDKIHDTLTADDFLKNRSEENKRSAMPGIIEESLEILKHSCNYAIDRLAIDIGGNNPNSSKPKNTIFQLIKLYSQGTGKKPTCYDDAYSETGFKGAFYNFLLDLNPILLKIDPEMNLGTSITIGDYAKKCIAKAKNFNMTA